MASSSIYSISTVDVIHLGCTSGWIHLDHVGESEVRVYMVPGSCHPGMVLWKSSNRAYQIDLFGSQRKSFSIYLLFCTRSCFALTPLSFLF
jgi:hypothetical protein